jgi:hypothetical protein
VAALKENDGQGRFAACVFHRSRPPIPTKSTTPRRSSIAWDLLGLKVVGLRRNAGGSYWHSGCFSQLDRPSSASSLDACLFPGSEATIFPLLSRQRPRIPARRGCQGPSCKGLLAKT